MNQLIEDIKIYLLRKIVYVKRLIADKASAVISALVLRGVLIMCGVLAAIFLLVGLILLICKATFLPFMYIAGGFVVAMLLMFFLRKILFRMPIKKILYEVMSVRDIPVSSNVSPVVQYHKSTHSPSHQHHLKAHR